MIPIGPIIVLCITILLSISVSLFIKTVYRTGFSLHLVLVPGTTMMGISLLLLFAYGSNSSQIGALFFAAHCLGLPFIVAWGEIFTRRMKAIAARGDFQVGLPAPSRGYRLLAMFGQLFQELTKSIVAVEGNEKLNGKLKEIGKEHSILLYMSIGDDGEFKVDERIIPILSKGKLELDGFLEFTDHVLRVNSEYMSNASISKTGSILKRKVQGTLAKYNDLLIQEGLLDRLGGGIFSDRASTGFLDFDKATGGGIPKNTSTMLCAPPSNEREVFMREYLTRGLSQGEKCIYATSSHPPQDLLASIGPQYSDNLMIIDCYTNRVAEVPNIVQTGNIITTPVELSVVKVALSRVLDEDVDAPKRAIIDILPTYLIFTSVEKIYLDLIEIIDDLNKAGYTSIFSLNPYVVDDEKKILTLQELFDSVLFLERVAHDKSSVSVNEMLFRVEKMANTHLAEMDIRVRKYSRADYGATIPSDVTKIGKAEEVEV